MGAFWDAWAEWEKMVFVLGAAIIVTVCAGTVKLAYQNWQLRKFTKISLARAVDPEMVEGERREHQLVPQQELLEDDIPFGVRAIESGIEVEGVWVSSNNSPASSAPPSPVLPCREYNVVRTSARAGFQQPIVAMPKPVNPQKRASSVPSISVTHPPDFSLIPLAMEAGDQRRQTLGLPGPSSHALRSYQPRRSSGLRFSSVDLSKLEGGPMLSPRSASDMRGSDRELECSRSIDSKVSTSSEESVTVQATKQLNQIFRQTDVRSPSPSHSTFGSSSYLENLEHISTHRRSQAAEIGQLMPRSRPPSTEHLATRARSRPNSPFPFLTDPRPSKIPRPQQDDPFKTPPLYHVETDDTFAPSFQSFLDSDPKNKQPHDDSFVEDSEVPTPLKALHGSKMLPRVPSWPVGLGQNHVIRKVNSGFEILRPGSFSMSADGAASIEPRTSREAARKSVRKLHKKQHSSDIPGQSSGV